MAPRERATGRHGNSVGRHGLSEIHTWIRVLQLALGREGLGASDWGSPLGQMPGDCS